MRLEATRARCGTPTLRWHYKTEADKWPALVHRKEKPKKLISAADYLRAQVLFALARQNADRSQEYTQRLADLLGVTPSALGWIEYEIRDENLGFDRAMTLEGFIRAPDP